MKPAIAEIGEGMFEHSFGGSDWRVLTPIKSNPPPHLLMTVDLRDPMVGYANRSDRIPLCSRTDPETFDRQTYTFNSETHTVSFLGDPWFVKVNQEDLLPNPLKKTDLILRPINEEEDVGISKNAEDTFLGGKSFIRIAGSPLWISEEEDASCECKRKMNYIACVGYEIYDRPSGIVSKEIPFFIGELALYFFACFDCRKVQVITQSS